MDESWAISQQDGRFDRRRMLGGGMVLYVGWVGGTALGVAAGSGLGDPATLGLDAAFPALFLALMVPLVKTRNALAAAVAGAGVALLLTPLTPAGLPVIAATVGVFFGLLPERAPRAQAQARGRARPSRECPRGASGGVMSLAWTSVLLVGVATVAIKAGGPVLAGERELPLRVGRMVPLVGPALLAALVATQAFATDDQLVLDERGAGLLAAAVAIALRAPIIVVVAVAAATAALLRLPDEPRGWLLFASMSVIWGVPYLFIKIAVEDLSAGFVAWSRVAMAAAVLLPIAWRTGALRGLSLRWLAAFALVEITIPFPLIAFGEEHLSSSLTAILIAAVPLMVAFLALRFDRSSFPAEPASWG